MMTGARRGGAVVPAVGCDPRWNGDHQGAASVRPVSVSLLGRTRLRIAGSERAIGGPRRTTVLAMLALSGARGISADSLADAVLPPSEGANRTLHVHVSQLRAQLAPYQRCLVRVGSRYRLDPDLVAVDTASLAAAVTGFDRGVPGAIAALRAVLEASSGELCSDLPDLEAIRAERSRCHELMCDGLEILFDAELEAGAGVDLPERIADALRAAPLRERLWAQLILALYAGGRQAEATSAYRRARNVLMDEIGVEPGPALRGLAASVLRQDPTLDRAAPARVEAAVQAVVWLDAVGRLRSVPLLPGHDVIVGRDARCTVRIDWDPAVSRRHAALTLQEDRCVVRDLGSQNGTFVDAFPVTGTAVLAPRASLRVGDSVLYLRGLTARVDTHQPTRC